MNLLKKIYRYIKKKFMECKLWISEVLFYPRKKRIGIKNTLLAYRYNFTKFHFWAYKLNKENIRDYISEYDRVRAREVNGDFKFLLDNKVIFTDFFGRYVSVPKILYLLLDNEIIQDDRVIQINELIDNLENKKVVFKGFSGGGGHGVHIFENRNKKFYWDYDEISREILIQKINELKNYIVNEYVVQHEYSSKIFPRSVNTVRVITMKDPETQKFIIPAAVHRFGNMQTGGVDNLCSGGYTTQIDVKTGILGVAKKLDDLTPIEKHPDTNEQIKGIKIPHWEKIKCDLLNVASKLPYMPFIGWDVVVTENGYEIIEANASCSLDLLQLFGPLKNSKIYEFYKYYGIIK